MKKNQKNQTIGWNILSSIIFVLLLAAEGWAIFRLHQLQVLPGNYFAILAGILAVFTLLLGILMFPRIGKHQKSKGIVRRIIAYVLSLLLTVGCSFGGMALGKLNNTFQTITQTPTVSAYVGVYVLAEDPAQEITDAKGYTLAITESYDPENSHATVEELETMWGGAVKTQTFDSVFAMIDALYDGKVQGMILNNAYLTILHEVEGYTDFETRARMLYEHSVMKVVETTPPTQPSKPQPTSPDGETLPTEDPLYAPFVVYLSGSDTRSYMLAQSRSDVNILAVVNPETKQILLINTPRDYYIPNPAGYGALDKLTHCGLWGTECSAQALGDLYGVSVDYTAQINFTGFETLIDSIGGINIYSDTGDGVFLSAGDNWMDGETALKFARNRYDYSDGDNARGRHQMQVIKAVVSKLSSGSIITNYSDILDSLEGMFTTTMPSEKISQLIKMQLKDMAAWDVQSYAVTGYGGSEIPYSMPGLYAYVMYPNMDTVHQASELMARVLNDEVVTAQDLVPVG